LRAWKAIKILEELSIIYNLILYSFKVMVSLKSQKRLAAEVLKCGRKRVWMDPNEVEQIGQANSRVFVRKLIKDGLIMKRKQKVHSRARARLHLEAKRKGNHTGAGKRRGTRESRMPTKILWVRRQRVLRRLLRKYREAKKIDRTLYHKFYLASKGNQFKNRTVLIEAIFKEKTKKVETQKLEAQQDARRQKNLELRKKRAEKQQKL
jgi:large subunit ribosomal protein L19e